MEEIMKKFKDFLYDKNDILIAVLILVVAAAIIAWRMDVILQYPKQLIHNDSQIETPPVDPSKTDDTASGDQTDNQTGSGDSTDGTPESTSVAKRITRPSRPSVAYRVR